MNKVLDINPQVNKYVAGVSIRSSADASVPSSMKPDVLCVDHIQAWGNYFGDLSIQLTSGALVTLSFRRESDRKSFLEDLRAMKNRA